MPEDFARRSVLLTPESPWICWSFLTIDLICSVTNSCSASSLTFRRKSRRIVSTCFLSSSALKKVPQKLTQFALMMSHHCLFYKLIWLFYEMWFGIWFSWFGKNAKTCWDGPDKMPTKKLGGTKCQQQQKSPDKMPTFGWHFDWLAFCPTTSYKVFRTILTTLWPLWNLEVFGTVLAVLAETLSYAFHYALHYAILLIGYCWSVPSSCGKHLDIFSKGRVS